MRINLCTVRFLDLFYTDLFRRKINWTADSYCWSKVNLCLKPNEIYLKPVNYSGHSGELYEIQFSCQSFVVQFMKHPVFVYLHYSGVYF